MPKEKKSTIIAAVAVVAALVLLYFVFVRPMMSGDTRILLVASDVLAQAGGKSKIESYLSSGTAVVPYNYDRVATYAELGDLVKATGASRVRSVGIMYHTPNRYNLKCFASDPEKSTVSGSPESFEPFRRFVVALRGAYGVEDVDLVSCDVVSAESNVLASLDFNGARVNASTNTTGQAKQGPVGDWVLESGNVNLIGRYFNASITTADLALYDWNKMYNLTRGAPLDAPTWASCRMYTKWAKYCAANGHRHGKNRCIPDHERKNDQCPYCRGNTIWSKIWGNSNGGFGAKVGLSG
jgi:hypothetical protein